MHLFKAIESGNLDEVKSIIAQNPAEAFAFQKEVGESFLHWAVRRGDLPLIIVLLETTKFKVNQTNKIGQTALHLAAARGRIDIAKTLFHHGADANLFDKEGLSPFLLAINHNHREMAVAILSWGGRFNFQTLSQSVLWGFMVAFGYRIEQEGICWGVARMGIPAVLNGDLPTFDHRLTEQLAYTKANNIIDCYAFLDAIQLYQNPRKFSYLFERPLKNQRDFLPIQELILPQVLAEKGGVVEIANFSGAYSQKNLTTYFKSIVKAIRETHIMTPIAFLLSDIKHAICIGYTPRNNKPWSLINANRLPTQYFRHEIEIAMATMRALGSDNLAVIATQIYGLEEQKVQLKAFWQYLRLARNWQKIHTVSTINVKQAHFKNKHWLLLAILYAQSNLVSQLLATKVEDVNLYLDKLAVTPLILAVSEDKGVEIIRQLILAGANVNQTNQQGMTALHVAAIWGDEGKIALLMEHGADIYQADKRGLTPLDYMRVPALKQQMKIWYDMHSQKALEPEALPLVPQFELKSPDIIEVKQLLPKAQVHSPGLF